GARSPSLFSPVNLARVPPASTPPGGLSADRFRTGLLSSPTVLWLDTRAYFFSRHRPAVHSSLRPARSLTPPCGASSVGFAGGGSPSPAPPQLCGFDLLPPQDSHLMDS